MRRSSKNGRVRLGRCLVHCSGLNIRPLGGAFDTNLGGHEGLDVLLLLAGPESLDFHVFRGEFVEVQGGVCEQGCGEFALGVDAGGLSAFEAHGRAGFHLAVGRHVRVVERVVVVAHHDFAFRGAGHVDELAGNGHGFWRFHFFLFGFRAGGKCYQGKGQAHEEGVGEVATHFGSPFSDFCFFD